MPWKFAKEKCSGRGGGGVESGASFWEATAETVHSPGGQAHLGKLPAICPFRHGEVRSVNGWQSQEFMRGPRGPPGPESGVAIFSIAHHFSIYHRLGWPTRKSVIFPREVAPPPQTPRAAAANHGEYYGH